MLAVIGQLLPLALAVALSTVPIAAVLTILLSPRKNAAIPFLIGVLLGMFLVTGAFALGLRFVPDVSVSGKGLGLAIAEMVVGAALIAYAVVLFVRRKRTVQSEELPRWLKIVGNIRAAPALGLGLVLAVRPKALLLSAAAGIVLGPAHLSVTAFVVVLVLFVAVGGSTVLVPVVFALARPEQAERPLAAAVHWITRNSRIVAILVVLIIGTVILGAGLANV
jgi:hypothetical protein